MPPLFTPARSRSDSSRASAMFSETSVFSDSKSSASVTPNCCWSQGEIAPVACAPSSGSLLAASITSACTSGISTRNSAVRMQPEQQHDDRRRQPARDALARCPGHDGRAEIREDRADQERRQHRPQIPQSDEDRQRRAGDPYVVARREDAPRRRGRGGRRARGKDLADGRRLAVRARRGGRRRVGRGRMGDVGLRRAGLVHFR